MPPPRPSNPCCECHDLERFRRVSLAESIDAITVGTFQKKSSDLNSIIISEISKVSTTTLPFSEIKETSEPVAPANESVDVDEYLLKIGEFGKVQKIILLVILVMCIPQSYHSISMYFTGHGPAWRCTGKTSECNMTGTFDVGDAFYEKRCSMNRSSWEFVQEKSYSIVTEWDLICEKKVYPFISSSILSCGWAIGAIFFGWATNRFGRKKIFFLSWTMMILGKIGSALSNHFWMFTTFELVVGIAQGGISLVLPVIATELVGPNYKTMVGSWIGFFHTFSICFMAIQGWLVLNWRHFLLITSAPYLILLASYKLIPESFRWLRLKNRLQEAEYILQKICKLNSQNLPKVSLKPIAELNKNPAKSQSLFKYKSILVSMIIQCLIWFINGQVFFGISMASGQLGGNIFRDFILVNLVGLPAAYIAMEAMNRLGRKPTLVIAFGAASLSCVAVTLIHPESKYVWGRIGSGMFGTLCMTVAFFGMYTWSLEILPTEIRSQCMGVITLMIRLGACSAPWVAQWLQHIHHTLPFAILGGAVFLAGILCTQLPETRGKPTAETLEDAVKNGSNVINANKDEDIENSSIEN